MHVWLRGLCIRDTEYTQKLPGSRGFHCCRIEWLTRFLVEMINEFCDQGVDFAVAAWDTTTEFPDGPPIRWLGG